LYILGGIMGGGFGWDPVLDAGLLLWEVYVNAAHAAAVTTL
jgi:hypothetical protein